MNIDSLKQAWQTQSAPGGSTEPVEILATTVQRSRQFDRAARQRTFIGMAMFLLPLPLMIFLFFVLPDNSISVRMTGIGVLIFMLSGAALIAFTGIFKTSGNESTGQTVEMFLGKQLRKISRQAWLFRNVVWWFWTPLLAADVILAVVMVFTNLVPINQYDLISVCLLPALAVYGARSARQYLQREILPWQREFKACLNTLQNNGMPN